MYYVRMSYKLLSVTQLDGNNVRSPGRRLDCGRVCNTLTRYGLDPIFGKSLSIRNLTFLIQATLA